MGSATSFTTMTIITGDVTVADAIETWLASLQRRTLGAPVVMVLSLAVGTRRGGKTVLVTATSLTDLQVPGALSALRAWVAAVDGGSRAALASVALTGTVS